MRDALSALDFGETQALLAPSKRRLHGNAVTLAYLRLVVLQHIYFQIGKGIVKYKALGDVANEMGVEQRRILQPSSCCIADSERRQITAPEAAG